MHRGWKPEATEWWVTYASQVWFWSGKHGIFLISHPHTPGRYQKDPSPTVSVWEFHFLWRFGEVWGAWTGSYWICLQLPILNLGHFLRCFSYFKPTHSAIFHPETLAINWWSCFFCSWNHLSFLGYMYIYIYMGMALKTVWIVPRWSGRLERGGYVKGHDPEVSNAPTRRSCFHDMTSYLYMSLWLGQRSHGKAERSSYSVHTSDSTWL